MRKLLMALMLALATPAFAANLYAENPPEIKVSFREEKPVGTGTYREFMVRAYQAAFWSKGGQWDAKSPHGLSLTYFWDIEGADIVDRTMDEMRHVRPNIPAKTLAAWHVALLKAIPDVLEGERITAIYTPKTATTSFFHQGKKTSEIKGKDFADAFFAIWLDEATNAQSLRASLLGQ